MAILSSLLVLLLSHAAALASAQAACYWHAGAEYRLPDSAGVVPCNNNGPSQCCRLGDICLEGNACYNYQTDDTYQYGCTDETYQDASCPYKCGWSPAKSPWVALEYCNSFNGIDATWNCQSPESCGCEWRATYELLELPPRQCAAMGSLARVAIYATNSLKAWASLPTTSGGSIGYFSPGVTTVVNGYTPSSIGPPTSVRVATTPVVYDAHATPLPSTGSAVLPNGSLPPIPSIPTAISSASSTPSSGLTSSSNPTSTITTTTSSSRTTGTPLTSSTSSAGGSGSGSGGGLTTGAQVGLGVGIGGGVALLAAIVIVAVVLRKRKARQRAETSYGEKPGHDSGTSAAYYDPYNRGSNVHEASYSAQEEANVRKRMSHNGQLPELDSGQPIHELESNAPSTAHTPPVGPGTSPRIG